MAWTDPITFAALTPLNASTLNQYVRDNLSYLKGIADGVTFKGVSAGRSTNQTIATATAEYIVWTSTTYDYGNWWTSGSKIIVPAAVIVAGFTTIACLVFARLQYASNNTGNRRLRVHVNGSSTGGKTVPGLDGGDSTDVDRPGVVIVGALDEIQVEAYQTSGGNLAVEEATVIILRFAPVA